VNEILKEKAYNIVNKFEEEVPRGQEYAEWETFKKVMGQFIKDEGDLVDIWGQRNLGGKFFFHVLADAVAPKPVLDVSQYVKENPRLIEIKRKI